MTLSPIESYVPHRDPMLLIHRLIEAGPSHAIAEVTVPADGLFVREGRVPGWVGIEYMAQTIAAWSGARDLAEGREPRQGMLLGTRRYHSAVSDFAPGMVLLVDARQEFAADNGLGMFDCRIFHQDNELATARLSVFVPHAGASLLKGTSP
jgi:predicted hotdog family 3-hydroxylacyl-ACP dehydratase